MALPIHGLSLDPWSVLQSGVTGSGLCKISPWETQLVLPLSGTKVSVLPFPVAGAPGVPAFQHSDKHKGAIAISLENIFAPSRTVIKEANGLVTSRGRIHTNMADPGFKFFSRPMCQFLGWETNAGGPLLLFFFFPELSSQRLYACRVTRGHGLQGTLCPPLPLPHH